MTSEEVAQLVRDQIADQWDRWATRDHTLRECLLEHPTKEMFGSRYQGTVIEFELWLVLEENPTGKTGYLVFYDEEDRTFGLAVRGPDGQNSYIGNYGNLWTTLEAM